MTRVSVLITARNRANELEYTLRQLAKQDFPDLDVLVIDDASGEGVNLREVVAAAYPSARFERNEDNIGLIASRSRGMQMTTGGFVLSLDDDSAPVAPDAITQAVARMEKEPEIGILSFFVHHGAARPAKYDPQQEQYTDHFIGCGHMIRRELVTSIGGYRDFFFYYGEEIDYSLRALDRGWRILHFPQVLVHHRASAIGRDNRRILGYTLRNQLWTAWLNLPLDAAVAETLWKLFSYGLEAARRLAPHWYLWAISSFVVGLPRVIRLRQPVSRTTYRMYVALRFGAIETLEDLNRTTWPSIRQIIHWFRNVWWHRRRARPFWDKRTGGVGKNPHSSYDS